MTARDDLADIAADALWTSTGAAQLDIPGELVGPTPSYFLNVAAILDALAERPDLHARWLTETGVLEQVGAVAPVRADGAKDGKWWHYRNDQDWPATAEPVPTPTGPYRLGRHPPTVRHARRPGDPARIAVEPPQPSAVGYRPRTSRHTC